MANIKVTLYDSTCETELSSLRTDAEGNYGFSGLEAGVYCVGVSELPTDFKVTTKDQGENDSRDSDINPESQKSDSFSLTAGESCNILMDIGLYEDRACVESRVYDDRVEANPDGATTEVDVLGNDFGELNGQTIALLDVEEGEILWSNGSVVAGTDVTQTQRLVIEGEGVWEVHGGKILFTAQEGFEEIPSPIYYVVNEGEGCSSSLGTENRPTNVAEVRIVSPCVCNTYETTAKDAVSLDSVSMLLMMLFSSMIASLFFFKEEES